VWETATWLTSAFLVMVRHQVALVSCKLTHGISGVNLPLFGSHYD
jgi:hypothetical protein